MLSPRRIAFQTVLKILEQGLIFCRRKPPESCLQAFGPRRSSDNPMCGQFENKSTFTKPDLPMNPNRALCSWSSNLELGLRGLASSGLESIQGCLVK